MLLKLNLIYKLTGLMFFIHLQACSGQDNKLKLKYIEPNKDSVAAYSEVIDRFDFSDTSLLTVVLNRKQQFELIQGSNKIVTSSTEEVKDYLIDYQKRKSKLLIVFDDKLDYEIVKKNIYELVKAIKKDTKYFVLTQNQYEEKLRTKSASDE